MLRLVTRALAAGSVLVAGSALAHPGHADPHWVHEADAIAGWWLVGLLAAGFVAAAWLGKARS